MFDPLLTWCLAHALGFNYRGTRSRPAFLSSGDQMRSKSLLGVALVLLAMTWVGCVPAQELGTKARVESGHTVPFGVPLAPPIYFVNFIFLYFANPATAALMPAYRVPLPELVYRCLLQNPDGCAYEKMAPFFQQQAKDRVSRGGDTVYPHYCQTSPHWQSLAPPVYQDPDQINEPLGPDKAYQLAQALGIDQSIILSPAEYQCVMGCLREIQTKRFSTLALSISLPRRETGSSSLFRVTG